MARNCSNWRAGSAVAALVVLTACMGLVSLAGCSGNTVPDALEGTWTTTEPAMEGRYLKLTGRLIIFGRGEQGEAVHSIHRIKSRKKDAGEMGYVFHYVGTGGEKQTLVLFHNPALGGTIRLRNRAEIWRRTTAGGTA